MTAAPYATVAPRGWRRPMQSQGCGCRRSGRRRADSGTARGPATTSPARSSGTRRPPERAHVHPTDGDQARSPDHTLNHASLVHHMSRPSIVRLGCSVVGVVVIGSGRRRPSPSATAPSGRHRRLPTGCTRGSKHPVMASAREAPSSRRSRTRALRTGVVVSGCSSRDRMWAACSGAPRGRLARGCRRSAFARPLGHLAAGPLGQDRSREFLERMGFRLRRFRRR